MRAAVRLWRPVFFFLPENRFCTLLMCISPSLIGEISEFRYSDGKYTFQTILQDIRGAAARPIAVPTRNYLLSVYYYHLYIMTYYHYNNNVIVSHTVGAATQYADGKTSGPATRAWEKNATGTALFIFATAGYTICLHAAVRRRRRR